MNKKQLYKVLEELGVKEIIEYEKNLQIPCILAKWRFGHTAQSDHSGSMGISFNSDNEPSKVNCFACKFRGSLSYLVRKYAQLSEKDLSKLVDWIDNIEDADPIQMILDLGEYGYESQEKRSAKKILCEKVLDINFVRQTARGLFSRGLDAGTVKFWSGYYDGKYKRVVFPVRCTCDESSYDCDSYQNLVGAIGRADGRSAIKYYNYFDFSKSRYFFGEHLATRNTIAVVVEGVIDTIAVWQALKKAGKLDEYSVLGLMGSEASSIQRDRLCEEFSSVISFFDNDPAGWTGQRRLILGIQDRTLLRGVRYPRIFGSAKVDPAYLVENDYDVAGLLSSAVLLATER